MNGSTSWIPWEQLGIYQLLLSGISYGFVGTSYPVNILVIDITNMRLVQTLASGNGSSLGYAIEGNRLYAGNNGNGLWVYDISNPLNIPAGTVLSASSLGMLPDYISFKNGLALVASRIDYSIVDLKDLSNPKIIRKYDDMVGNLGGLTIYGDLAYLATDRSVLTILDFF